MHKSDFSQLSVSPDATTLDIKRAYRKLAMRHHPDKGGDPAAFGAITKAYESIMDQRAGGDAPAPSKMTFTRRSVSVGGVVRVEKACSYNGVRVELSKPKSSY